MADLTVANYLGMLQEDPYNAGHIEGLREALGRGSDPASNSDEERAPLRLLEAARSHHERRGEFQAAAWLMEIEAELVEDDPEFRADLLRELGRIRHDELMDDQGARSAWAAAHDITQGDPELGKSIEQVDQAAENWRELADRFAEEGRDSADQRLRASLLARAAAMLWQYGGEDVIGESDALFDEALGADPSHMRTVHQYAHSLRARTRWNDVVSVYLRGAHAARTRDDKESAWLHVARVYRGPLEDGSNAADAYAHVLEVAPQQQEALGAVVEQLTAEEAWDRLAAAYENALRSRQKLEDEKGVLVQLAMVHWRFREDPHAAEPYFARLRKIDAAHPGMLDFYRSYTPEDGEARLLTILGDAVRSTSDLAAQKELAIELAKRSQQDGRVDRAIEAWKHVQRLEPGHKEAKKQLRKLYESGGKWNALAESLRQQIDALPQDAKEQRLNLLRELVPIYRDELGLDAMLVQIYQEIIREEPDDVETMDALIERFESLGRWNELIQALTTRADTTEDVDRRVDLYMQAADLWVERFANFNQATRPLERVIELQPNHRGALRQLKEIYAKKRKWDALVDILAKEASFLSDPQARLNCKIQMAELCGERLRRNADAIKLWREIVDEAPDTPNALDTLERLAERDKDWETLAYALDKRMQTGAGVDRQELLLRLGTVKMERLGDAHGAVEAWSAYLENDPENTRVRRMLRDAHVAAGDWEAVESLYGGQQDWGGLAELVAQLAERAEEPSSKVELSFREAEVYRDKLGEPGRAVRAYERVLEADRTNVDAARALADLYQAESNWEGVARSKEILYSQAADDEKLGLASSLRDLYLDHVRDPVAAFGWAKEAFLLADGDPDVTAAAVRAADEGGRFDQLVDVLQARADNATTPEAERLSLKRRIAAISGERLGRSDDAIAQLESILETEPEDAEALAILDRLYRATRRFEDLRGLYNRRLRTAADDDERRVLLGEVAKLEEQQLGDLNGAADRYWALIQQDPNDRDALAAVERLSQSLEQWPRFAHVLERRLAESVDDDEALATQLKLGDLRRQHLQDASGAFDSYASALAIDGRSAVAITGLEALGALDPSYLAQASEMLERAYERRGDFTKLAELLRSRLEAVTDDAERKSVQLRLAELSATELGDPRGAYDAVATAFKASPNDAELAERLSVLAEAADAHDQYATLLATVLDKGKVSPPYSAALARRTAELYDDVLGEPESAERFYRHVLDHEPDDNAAFVALKQVYTKAERWDELRKLYQTRIEATVDGTAKLDLLSQLCFLFEEILNEPDHAISTYEQALELDPAHTPSRRALQRLYTRQERWSDLGSLLRRDLDEAHGQERTDLAYELANLYESQLGSSDDAIEYYEVVLQESPTHLRAQEGLQRIMQQPAHRQRIAASLEPVFESQGAWPELGRVLEVQLEDLSDPGSRAAHLMRLAELAEDKLRDSGKAYDYVARSIGEEPASASARAELTRLAASQGRHGDRARVLQQAFERVDDDFVKTELLLELAELWDEHEPDPEKAEQAYRELVQIEKDNPDIVLRASRALERLHTASSDFAALADDYRRQIEFEEDPSRRSELLGRLAELLQDTLNDPVGAIAVHRRRLEEHPGDPDVLWHLQNLYESQGQWQPLIDVLEQRADSANDEEEQRAFHHRIAEVHETRLHDTERATSVYADTLSRFGNDDRTLEALNRLYRSAGRWHELLDITETQARRAESTDDQVRLKHEAAELMRRHTNELERAYDTYTEIFAEVPGHSPTLRSLEEIVTGDGHLRMAAAKQLLTHYRDVGAHEDQVRMLRVTSEADDAQERVAALLEAASVSEHQLDDFDAAFDFQRGAIAAGFLGASRDELMQDFERYAQATSRWAEYSSALTGSAKEVFDGDARVDMLSRAARVSLTELGDLDGAVDSYQRVLEEQPDHRDAVDALINIAETRNEPSRLVELLRRKVEQSSDTDERSALLVRQASIYEHELHNVDAAIDAYDQALGETNVHEAYEGLDRLYRQESQWESLATLYERKLDQGIGEADQERYQLGVLCRDKLGDGWRALDQFREALRANPDHEPSLAAVNAMMGDATYRNTAAELLEPVYLKRMDWPQVTAILRARLEGEDDPVQRREVLRRLGEVQEAQLEDLDGALETYGALFVDDPYETANRDTVTRLARSLDRWDRLAEFFDQVLSAVEFDDENSTELALTTAQLFEERVGNKDRAAHYYRRVITFDPSHSDAAAALARIYESTGKWSDLHALQRERANFSDDDSVTVELLTSIASIEASKLNAPADAIETYRRVLELDPHNAQALEALDDLLTYQERWDELSEHLQFRIDNTHDLKDSLPLRHRLAMVTDQRLGQLERAVDMFEDIVADEPNFELTVRRLEDLIHDDRVGARACAIVEPVLADAGEWRRRLPVLEAQVGLSDDAYERGALLKEIARVHEEDGGDPTKALDTWGRALVNAPDDELARGEVDKLGRQLGSWDTYIGILEHASAGAPAASTRAALLRDAAKLHDEDRGDPRAAIATYKRVLDIEATPDDLNNLEGMLVMVGDWEGMAQVYERKLTLSADRDERVELQNRLGALWEEQLGDVRKAIDYFEQAAADDESNPTSLESLDRLLSQAGEHERLAEVLSRRFDVEDAPSERAEIGLRLAETHETQLGSLDNARDALRRVLEADPQQPAALENLARLSERQGDWSELVDVLRRQVALADEGPIKVDLTHRIGNVLERELDDERAAVHEYGHALEQDATHEPTIQALLRVTRLEDYREDAAAVVEPYLRTHERWDDLAEVLSLRAEAITDPFDKADMLVSLADVHERGRQDPGAAFITLTSAIAERPDDEVVLDRAEALGGAINRLDAYTEAVSAQAGASADPERAAALWRRVARVSETSLGDSARAIEATQQVIANVGDQPEELEALSRLYKQNGNWERVQDVLERRMGLGDVPRSTLLMQQAELRANHLGDPDGALALLQEVLELEPGSEPAIAQIDSLAEKPPVALAALDVLEDVFRGQGELERVVGLLQRRAQWVDSDVDRVALLQESARIWDAELGRADEALAVTVDAFRLSPDDPALIRDLERLAADSGNWESLRGLVDQIATSGDLENRQLYELRLREAGWYRDHLGDAAAAERSLTEALQLDPEPLEAHDQRVALLRDQDRAGDLVAALRAWAQSETDPSRRATHLREAANVAESALGDQDLAADCLQDLLLADRTDGDALAGLQRIREEQGRWNDVAGLLERRVELADPAGKSDLLRTMGEVYEGRLQDARGAIAAYEDAFKVDDRDEVSMDALERLYGEHDRFEALRSLLQHRLSLAGDVAEQNAVRMRLATLFENSFTDYDAAIGELRHVLEAEPTHREAQQLLERLLESKGDWNELIATLESGAQTLEGSALATQLSRIASIHLEHRRDVGAATLVYERLRDHQPDDSATLAKLTSLYTTQDRWTDAAESVEARMRISSDSDALELAHEAADLWEERVGDVGRATEAMKAAYGRVPTDERTTARLRAQLEAQGDHAGIAGLLADELGTVSDDARRFELLKGLAGLYREKLGDPGTAAQYLEQAAAMTDDDREILVPLCDLYIEAGRQSEAVPILQKIISSFGKQRSKDLARHQHTLGRALRAMGDDDGALEAYDAAFKIDLTNVAILRDLGKLTLERGDLDRAQKSFRALLLQKLDDNAGIAKADVYFYLGDIASKQGDARKAKSMLERALAEDRDHAAAKDLLSQLKG